MNELIAQRKINDFIEITETFQQKNFSKIASQIIERKTVRVVLIAGPSSSGKTTSAKKLALELQALGYTPKVISLDCYYAGKDKTPLDENGQPDFECLEALNIELLNQSGGIEDLPLRALFVGAKASFNIGKYELTRSFLDQAEKFSRQAAEASRVVRAKLNLRVNNAKAALEDLSKVRRGLKNRLIYRLYFLSYQREHDLGKLSSISKELQKYKLITEDEARQIDEEFFASQLRDAKTPADLKELWKGFSRQMRHDPKVAGPFTARLVQSGDLAQARSIALVFLKKGLDPAILESVSKWEKGDREVLDFLRNSAAQDEISGAVNLPLLTARGNLEYRLGMNQEALDDYRRALELKPSAETYTRIGQILASQQNYAEATDCFSKAASFDERQEAVKLKY